MTTEKAELKPFEGEIEVNGVRYIPKNPCGGAPGQLKNNPIPPLKGLILVLIRSYASGVHVGYINRREDLLAGLKVELLKSRRIFYWEGAASLSQLAVDGVNLRNINKCKFSIEVESMEITQVIEIIPVTAKAAKSINSVPVWKI